MKNSPTSLLEGFEGTTKFEDGVAHLTSNIDKLKTTRNFGILQFLKQTTFISPFSIQINVLLLLYHSMKLSFHGPFFYFIIMILIYSRPL